jgi:hypothetical protein
MLLFISDEFRKTLPLCRGNSPQTQIADSSSANAVSLSSTHNELSVVAMGVNDQSFARWNARLTEIAQVHGCFSSQSFGKRIIPERMML